MEIPVGIVIGCAWRYILPLCGPMSLGHDKRLKPRIFHTNIFVCPDVREHKVGLSLDAGSASALSIFPVQVPPTNPACWLHLRKLSTISCPRNATIQPV